MKEEMKGNTGGIFTAGVSRRQFLSYTGLAGSGLLIASCSRDDDKKDPVPDSTINLGSGDTGVLNYFFALEQLNAAFYTQVRSSFYSDISDLEMSLLKDISEHEVAHRELFRNIIGDANLIPNLEFDFSMVDFSARMSVLGNASILKELCVAAYNGAAQYLTTPDYCALAGKISSVEARHAALLLELMSVNSFADYTNGDGMDTWKTPDEILVSLDKNFKTKVSAKNLPKS